MGEICCRLHQIFNLQRIYDFPYHDSDVPLNGVYLLFEAGELAHGGKRIVRVGTHTGQNQLRSRLKQHFLLEKKDRSIFRKNIGRALLMRDRDPFLYEWEIDLTRADVRRAYAGKIDTAKLIQVEKKVTEYIQRNITFSVLEVTSKQDRLQLESRLISTVSLCKECQPSNQWLGQDSPNEKIRESGLWNVNELYKTPLSEQEFRQFFALCARVTL